MRIITEGNPSKRIKDVVAKCKNCGCEFAFTDRDLVNSYNFLGEHTLALYCPFCGRYVSPESLEEKHE